MNEENEKDLKIYELGFLLVPELAEDEVAGEVGALKNLILDKIGGIEISSEMPKPIELAYQMDKRVGGKIEHYNRAHFGWIKFELPVDNIEKLNKALEENKKIIRFIVIKTVRENTMAVKRVIVRPPADAKKKEDGPLMTEEEMDKTIAELVVE